jgi:hypothetical protein
MPPSLLPIRHHASLSHSSFPSGQERRRRSRRRRRKRERARWTVGSVESTSLLLDLPDFRTQSLRISNFFSSITFPCVERVGRGVCYYLRAWVCTDVGGMRWMITEGKVVLYEENNRPFGNLLPFWTWSDLPLARSFLPF